MRKYLLLLILLLALAIPASAQGELSVTPAAIATDAVVATAEAVATQEAPVIVNIEAPEPAPAPAVPPIDWQTIVTGILAVVVVLNQYTNGGVVKTVAGIFKVSQEQAQEWYDRGVKAGIQQQLIAALKTETKDDDDKAYKLAREAGYKVVMLGDGTPVLEKLPAGSSAG